MWKCLNKYQFDLVPFSPAAVLFLFSFTAQIDQIGCIILAWLSRVFDFGWCCICVVHIRNRRRWAPLCNNSQAFRWWCGLAHFSQDYWDVLPFETIYSIYNSECSYLDDCQVQVLLYFIDRSSFYKMLNKRFNKVDLFLWFLFTISIFFILIEIILLQETWMGGIENVSI